MDLPAELVEMGLPFANQINKKLENEVASKEVEIRSLQSKIEDHSDRIQALSEHRKNVLQELQQTQALHEARRRDHETEDHLKQIAEREEGRLNGVIKQAKSELDTIKEQMNIYENNIYRIIQEVDVLKTQMKMDQTMLNAYLEKSAEKDEDAMIIQKYARQDESKIKELTLKVQSLQDNQMKNRRDLDKERTETISAQIELDKTAEEFRRTHQQRQELLGQWEDTIDQMKKRDSDMERTASDLAAVRSEIREKEEGVNEKREFLEEEKRNAEEVEKKVNMSERQSAKMRLDLQDAETLRIQFKDELETLKYSVDRTATDLESMRAQCSALSRQTRDQTERLSMYQSQRRALQEEIRKKTKGLLSAEERAQEMDELLNIEETNVKRIEKELEKTREKQFKKSQKLFEQKKSDSVLAAELHGCRVASKNLMSNQRKLDEESLKQQEILYTQDFQLQQQERRVGRMQGERSDEEQGQLDAKLKELEEEGSRQLQEETLLKNQLKKLQDNLRRVSRRLEKSSRGKEQLTGRIDEVNLHIDSTQREMKKLIANKQDMMVEENILKLEVKRLREMLFLHADEVHSLERKKLQLHTAMSERTKEIDIHKDMLRAEMKTAESDRQTASAEVHDRFSKIERLRKRYEILMVAMAPPEGEEERSAAYYVIKAAQEREELQRQGDELDAKIQKAEREIKALENTLKLMNTRNTNYRTSLTRADVKGEEVAELDHLEGQLQTLMDKFKHNRRDLKMLKDDTKTMSSTLTGLSTNEDVFATLVDERKKGLNSLHKEIEEQRQKVDRVKKQTIKLQRTFREKRGVSHPAPEEVDMSIRELRGLNLNIAQHLSQVGSYHGDLGEPLKQMFAEANIPPPSTPLATPTGSRMSSRPPSSMHSSRSSVSSQKTSVSSRGGPTPIQPRAIEIGMSPTSSRDGWSSRTSTASLGKKQVSSRASSKVSSKQSSRTSSRAPSRSTSKTALDLSIGPT